MTTPATYTYRSGVAPTAVDTMTEMAREEATAAAGRIQGTAFSRVHEIRPAVGYTVDTNADEYTVIFLIDGTAIKGARQAFPCTGIGSLGSGATIAPAPLIQRADAQLVEVESAGSGDFGLFQVQHGDTVSLGFAGLGVTYS